jgi:long-chain acyl-CoA synthetase
LRKDYARFYQPGVPATIDEPTDSLVELLETAVAQAGSRQALDFFGRRTSYRDLGEKVERVAEGLRLLGVSAGDRVALILPNCPQHVIAFYAVLRLGAIVVEHNPLYTARELRHMFEDHAARVVICWDKAIDNVLSQPGDIGFDHIISVNMIEEFPLVKRLALKIPLPSLMATRAKLTAKVPRGGRILAWKKLLDSNKLSPSYPRPGVRDTAAIQYTSGTTGLPKGAVLTHSNLYSNAIQGHAWTQDVRIGHEVLYAALPFFHAFGLTLFMTFGILKQARIHLFPTPDVDLIMAAAKVDPPTFFVGVPPLCETVANASIKRKISLKSIKSAISGAMTLPEDIRVLWEGVTGGKLIEGYGMTESSPVTLGNPFHTTRKPGTVGVPFPSTFAKLVDVDDNSREVETGERGELWVKGPQVFHGYWNNPEETAKSLVDGVWLRTGDIAIQDEDGFTTIVDRIKELIITGGFNVAPTEVEQVLRAHPSVADAAVVGLPSSRSGETVVAAVIPEAGEVVDSDSVRAFCRARLAAYKVPRKIILVDSLPKSLLGKVLRGQVRTDLLTLV